MKVVIGNEGLDITFQDPFSENVECVHCGSIARIGFVAHEMDEDVIEEGKGIQYVSQLHDNEKGNMWLHDACSVAVYFCTKCLNTTAVYNQA